MAEAARFKLVTAGPRGAQRVATRCATNSPNERLRRSARPIGLSCTLALSGAAAAAPATSSCCSPAPAAAPPALPQAAAAGGSVRRLPIQRSRQAPAFCRRGPQSGRSAPRASRPRGLLHAHRQRRAAQERASMTAARSPGSSSGAPPPMLSAARPAPSARGRLHGRRSSALAPCLGALSLVLLMSCAAAAPVPPTLPTASEQPGSRAGEQRLARGDPPEVPLPLRPCSSHHPCCPT